MLRFFVLLVLSFVASLPSAFAQAPVITGLPRTLEVMSGESSQISVTFTGDPTPAIQWYLGIPGDTSRPISGATTATANLPAFTAATRVWVRLTNSSGSVDSQSVLVTPWTFHGGGASSRAVIHVGGRFVAAGRSGIATSPDGVDWTVRLAIPDTASGMSGIAYGNGRFIAVGYDRQAVSTDGDTWTLSSIEQRNVDNWVRFGGGVFFRPDNGGIVVSTDGTSWTRRSVGDALATTVDYFKGRFVAIGTNGAPRVYTSTDAVTWTGHAVPWTATDMDGSRLSVVGENLYLARYDRLYCSSDGMTWQAAGSVAGDAITQIVYGNGVYVAGSQGAMLYRSTDGLVWTQIAAKPHQSSTLVQYVGGQFFTFGANRFVFSSSDGLTWTQLAGAPPTSMRAVTFHNGTWLATGMADLSMPRDGAYQSTDGVNWVGFTSPPTFTAAPVIVNGKYIAAGAPEAWSSAPCILRSTDSGTWESQLLALPGPLSALLVGPDRLLAFGGGKTARSNDGGATWSIADSMLYSPTRAAYGAGRYVAGGEQVYQSADGVSWSWVNGVGASGGLIYAGGLFVAVSGGSIHSSADGVTWVRRADTGSNYFKGVAYGNGRFIAAGTEAYYSSLDGITWSRSAFGRTTVPAGAIAFGDGQFLAEGFPAVLKSVRDDSHIEITQQPAPSAKATGEGVTFVAAAASTTALSYQWVKDGASIAGQTGPTLTLPSVTAAHQGQYWVQITNTAGGYAVSSRVALIVDPVAPSVSVGPSAPVTNPGAAVTLTATATGNPAPSLQWRKNGTVIVGATGPQLSLANVSLTDAGEYTVVAANTSGTATSDPAIVTVKSLGITATPAPVVGGSVQFTVEAVPATSYQWRYKGVPIEGATGATLTLPNLSRAQNGFYDVVLTYGSESRASQLYALDVAPAAIGPYYSIDPEYPVRLEREGEGRVLAAASYGTDGAFLVGGDFTTLGSQTRPYLAVMRPDGELDTTLTLPLLNAPVRDILRQADGGFVIAGDFTAVNGRAVGRLTRLKADLTVDENFLSGVGFSGPVFRVAAAGTGFLCTGDFDEVSGAGRNQVAKLSASGELEPQFGAGLYIPGAPSGPGRALWQLADGRWLVGGGWEGTNSSKNGWIVALKTDGTRDETWIPDSIVNYLPVLALRQQGNGSIFVALKGNPAVVRLSVTGARESGFNLAPGVVPNGEWVEDIELASDGLLIGGSGFPVARLTFDGHLATLPNPSFGEPDVARIQGSRFWGRFAGSGGAIGGYVQLGEAAWSGPIGQRPRAEATVYEAHVVAGGKALVRGSFTHVNGAPSAGLVQLTANGAVDAFTVPAGLPIEATGPLAIQGDGRILIHGGDALRRYLSDGAVDTSFPPIAYVPLSLAIDGRGRILLGNGGPGGTFGSGLGVRVFGRDGQPDATLAPVDSYSFVQAIIPKLDGTVQWWTDPRLPVGVSVGGRIWTNSYSVDPAVLPLPGDAYLQGGWPSMYHTTATYLEHFNAAGQKQANFVAAGLAYNLGKIDRMLLQDDGSILAFGRGLSATEPRIGIVRLQLSVAPGIQVQPASQTVTGGGVTFTVTATGSRPLSYQWYRDGVAIPGRTTNTLTLTNLQLADYGRYTVSVTNPFGSVHSEAVTFTGSAPAPTITALATVHAMTAGTASTLAVTATGTGTLSYQWRKSGYVLPGENQATLTFANPTLADAGLYDVLVADGLSVTVSPLVEVRVAPRSYPNRLVLDQSFNPVFEKVGGKANAVLAAPGGKYIVSGDFTRLGGVSRPGLARLNADLTVDLAFNPPAELGEVQATLVGTEASRVLAVLGDGRVYVAQPLPYVVTEGVRNRLVRLLASGAIDPSFSMASEVVGVGKITVQPDGALIVLGDARVSGGLLKKIFRLTATGALDPAYFPAFTRTGEAEPVQPHQVIVQPSGRAVVAGWFTALNGTPVAAEIVRLNADGSLDPTFAITGLETPSISRMELTTAGELVLLGSFGPQSWVREVVRVSVDGAYQATVLDSNYASTVTEIAVQADRAVIANGGGSGTVMRLARTGAPDQIWNLTPDESVPAFVADGSGGVVGCFLGTDGQYAIRRGAADGTSTGFATLETTASVNVITPASGGSFYVAGDFTRVNGTPAGRVARIRHDGSLDPAFAPGEGMAGNISDLLTLPDQSVIAVGDLLRYRGQSVRPLVSLRPDGSLNPAFNVPASVILHRDLDMRLGLLGDGRVLLGTPAWILHRDGTPSKELKSGGESLNRIQQFFPKASGELLARVGFGPLYRLSSSSGEVLSVSNSGLQDLSAVGVLADGHVLAAGRTVEGSSIVSAVRRLSANLERDATFTSSGLPVLESTHAPGLRLILQEDGKPILWDDRGFFRLDPTGAMDATFDMPIRAAAHQLGTRRSVDAVALTDSGALLVGDRGMAVNGVLRRGLFRFIDDRSVVLPQPLAGQTVFAGDSASFSITPTGTGPFTYRWYKDGTLLTGETGATLTLSGLTTSQSGTYRVEVSNAYGPSHTSSTTLDVRPVVAPTITQDPAPLHAVAQGQPAVFTVGVAGAPAPTIQWLKDGDTLTGATGATLTIPAVAVTDRGRYSARASNSGGTVTSMAAALWVMPTGMSATHDQTGGAIGTTTTAVIGNTFTFPGAAQSFTWNMSVPTGWEFVSSTVPEAQLASSDPTVVSWRWEALAAKPHTFSYTLRKLPEGNVNAVVQAVVEYEDAPDAMFAVAPRALVLFGFHSADIDRNYQLSLLELTRVIELYNTRSGTTRTGCYRVQSGTTDGFAAEATRADGATVTLEKYHSADTNRDGKLSLLELTRVIELYNYRSGTSRTGHYRRQNGTSDGFAPGL